MELKHAGAGAAGDLATIDARQGLGEPWQAGPALGLIAQLLLLVVLASTVGLGRAGWVVGLTSGVIIDAALAYGLSRYRCERMAPADWVTLARATLAVAVAALVAESFVHRAPVAVLVVARCGGACVGRG